MKNEKLMTCPECENTISKKANTCPHCGYDLTAEEEAKVEVNHHLQNLRIFTPLMTFVPLFLIYIVGSPERGSGDLTYMWFIPSLFFIWYIFMVRKRTKEYKELGYDTDIIKSKFLRFFAYMPLWILFCLHIGVGGLDNFNAAFAFDEKTGDKFFAIYILFSIFAYYPFLKFIKAL